MSNDKMGGPVYPTTHAVERLHNGTDLHQVINGMTLWDYYAAAALPECLYTIDGTIKSAVEAASRAGEMADAMLAERNKRMENN